MGRYCKPCHQFFSNLANYCNQCGTKLPDISEEDRALAEAEAADIELCGELGHTTQAVSGAKFCIGCGRPLSLRGS